MNPMTLTNRQLAAALAAAIAAVKETRGSANLKQARQRALFSLKSEAQRRVNLGAR
jgi:Trp operon repressor